jgi:hypothetical protein
MDRETSKVIPAREIREGDIVKVGVCPDGSFSQPVWTRDTKCLEFTPEWVRDRYQEFARADEQVFHILHVVPPTWKIDNQYSDKHYDTKFIVMSELGVVVVWTYDWEIFEVLSGD